MRVATLVDGVPRPSQLLDRRGMLLQGFPEDEELQRDTGASGCGGETLEGIRNQGCESALRVAIRVVARVATDSFYVLAERDTWPGRGAGMSARSATTAKSLLASA